MATLGETGLGQSAAFTGKRPGLFASKSVVGWLVFWFAIALFIRLMNLTAKPAWMDEISTVMFSLGNSSRFIPTDQAISLDQILVGLRLRPDANSADVVNYLLSENNHPPAYFVLAQGWMKLAQAIIGDPKGYASLWAARALPALLGAAAVPAAYFLSWLSFYDSHPASRESASREFDESKSASSESTSHQSVQSGAAATAQPHLIGLTSAALMAVSPFSIFLSQEARHYTLAILMIMASLCCFTLAVRAVCDRTALGWLLILAWVVINTLSIAVHYFCGIALCAEGGVLLVMLVRQCLKSSSAWRQAPWPKIYVAAVGTLAGACIWLPILLNFYGSPQTTYITSEQGSWKFWIDPLAQSVVGWLYAFFSPITNGFGWQGITIIVLTSVSLLLLYAPWLLRQLRLGLQFQWTQPSLRPGLLAIGGFFAMANLLFFLICYGVGFDITRGHRYSFVYFPSIIILAGAGLAPFWQGFAQVKLPFIKQFIRGRTFVATVLFLGFLGTQVIVNDLSHLKFYKANRLVDFIQQNSTLPVVIAVDSTISAQPTVIGNEIVSVAWEVKRQLDADPTNREWVSEPQFVIAERNLVTNSDPRIQLIESIKGLPRPFDLWVLNMDPSLDSEQCLQPSDNSGTMGSHRYTHYICKQLSS